MTDHCSCSPAPSDALRLARGKRIRDGGILFGAATILALFGVDWGVPLALALLGVLLLLAMAIAALFDRESPGALEGRWIVLPAMRVEDLSAMAWTPMDFRGVLSAERQMWRLLKMRHHSCY